MIVSIYLLLATTMIGRSAFAGLVGVRLSLCLSAELCMSQMCISFMDSYVYIITNYFFVSYLIRCLNLLQKDIFLYIFYRNEESGNLDSSHQQSRAIVLGSDDDKSKFAFTIWTQATTTTTITTVFTDPGTTVSMSVACSVGFINLPMNPCVGWCDVWVLYISIIYFYTNLISTNQSECN